MLVGKTTVANMMKAMRAESGILANTNHSVHATGGSTMFQANVSVKIIILRNCADVNIY